MKSNIFLENLTILIAYIITMIKLILWLKLKFYTEETITTAT